MKHICVMVSGLSIALSVCFLVEGLRNIHTHTDLANFAPHPLHGVAHSTQCSSDFQLISYVSMQICTVFTTICLFCRCFYCLFFAFIFVFFFSVLLVIFLPIVKRCSSRDFCLNRFMNY